MADKRIVDVDFLDEMDNDASFFINQNNALKQINKSDAITSLGIDGIKEQLDYKMSDNPSCIELNLNGESGISGGYIDFHYAGERKDYTSRIIENSKGIISIDNGTSCNEILHKGHKPTGSYSGNNDSAQRIISIGGTGNVIVIWNSSYMSLVTPLGAICVDDDGAIVSVSKDEVNFANGNLTLETTKKYFNADTEHYYQVL